MFWTITREIFIGSQNYLEHSSKSESSKPAPGTSIYYDENLIDKLESDHVAMKNLFTKIIADARKGRIERVRDNLVKLDVMLKRHAVLEYIRLYVYLLRTTEHDEIAHDIVIEFRAEMMQIDKAISKLVLDSETMNIRTLKKALEDARDVITDRITREETILYPIYAPI
jgi:hypothetical protein